MCIRDSSRGTGGYAHYNRNWETRTWNEETEAALVADMAAGLTQPAPEDSPVDQYGAAFEGDEAFLDYGASDREETPELGPKSLLAVGGILVGGLIAVRYGKPWWNNTVRPAAKKLRDKFSKRESGEAQTPEATEGTE